MLHKYMKILQDAIITVYTFWKHFMVVFLASIISYNTIPNRHHTAATFGTFFVITNLNVKN
jgi:hypothetical protein